MKGLISAFHTLTILGFKKTEGDLSDSLYWFPIVGLFIGLILCSIYWIWNLLHLPNWKAGIAFLIITGEILITRALHIDGLSDWADSIGAFDKEKKLEIMKDPHMGTFGAVAIVWDLLFRLITIYRILSCGNIICILIIPSISRTMMVEMCVSMPYARKNGTGAPFVKGAKNRHRILAFLICGIISLLYGLKGIILFIIAFFITYVLKWIFKRGLDGITGDTLGATNEIISVSLFFIGAIL